MNLLLNNYNDMVCLTFNILSYENLKYYKFNMTKINLYLTLHIGNNNIINISEISILVVEMHVEKK